MSSSLRKPCIIAGGDPTGGSTINAMLGFIKSGYVSNVEIACIITSRNNAGVFAKAAARKFPREKIFVVSKRQFATDAAVDAAIIRICEISGADSIWQSGSLRRTGKAVISRFRGCIWNQHPGALNPTAGLYKGHRMDFGGVGMHGIVPVAAALYFARLSKNPMARFARATAHMLTEDEKDIDGGKVIGEQLVPIDIEKDSPETLQSRLKRAEQFLQASMMNYLATHGHFFHYSPQLIVASNEDADHMVTARERALSEYGSK